LNKAAVLVLTLVIFNLVLVFFDTQGFFSYQPQGVEIEYDVAKYGFANLLVDGFIITGLALLGLIISAITRINAFAMILFVEIFWFPYYKVSGVFYEVMKSSPEVALGLAGIFTTIMLFVFAYALIEMSSSTVVTT